MMITVYRIDTNHEYYEGERELRNKILLRPIGLADNAWEMHDGRAWHFVAVEGGRVVGCVVLNPLNEERDIAQLMQMAVDTHYQGKGIGTMLVEALLQFCKESGVKHIECHSRTTAVPFYETLGFEKYGDEFEEVGVKHFNMRRIGV